MKVVFLFLMFLFASVSIQANPGFQATITDKNGHIHEINISTIGWGNHSSRRFAQLIDVRRGEADVQIRLEEIRHIEFRTAPVERYALIEVTTLDDRTAVVLFRLLDRSMPPNYTTIRGIDNTFGTPFEIRASNVESIRFHHDTVYKKCPTTGEMFYQTGYGFSPYTGEQLEKLQSSN